jgi:bacterioferritin
MGTTATALVGEAVADVADRLDSFHAYHQLAAHWADAVRLRLEGPAAYLIPDQLVLTAQASRAAADRLAARLADLGTAPTADPSLLVERSPLDSFELPKSFSDVGSILTLALDQIRTIIREYGAFLSRFREADPLSYHLVVELLAPEVTRETEIESVL